MRFKSKTDKGVAGLTILLSLVTMLFVIGFLVMIFALMGSELQDATGSTAGVTGEVTANETLTIDGTGITSEIVSSNQCGYQSWLPITVMNCTEGCAGATNETLTLTTDYTVNANGSLINVTHVETPLLVIYNYTWGGQSCEVINETTVAVSDVTDWFAIFIVIGAMVVLILLTVIIITAIRGSGLMQGTG